MSNPILTAFNNQFVEFIEDILRLFPGDKDLLLSKNGILTLKKGNPKLLIQIWKQFIADVYLKEIEAGDISFFIEKDYTNDVKLLESDKVVEVINRLRNPIREMDQTNRDACMKYIQNMTKLTQMYFK